MTLQNSSRNTLIFSRRLSRRLKYKQIGVIYIAAPQHKKHRANTKFACMNIEHINKLSLSAAKHQIEQFKMQLYVQNKSQRTT